MCLKYNIYIYNILLYYKTLEHTCLVHVLFTGDFKIVYIYSYYKLNKILKTLAPKLKLML